MCGYCGGPLNEDVTCRILAGNKPNTVYWILLLGSVTNETSKIYNKKTVTIQFGYDFFSDKRIIQVLCPLAVDKRLWINSYGRLYQSIPLYVRGKEKEVSLKL